MTAPEVVTPGRRPNTTLLFLVVCSVLTIDAMAWGVVVPFLPQRGREIGASTFQITVIYAAYSAGLLLFTVPAGVASDRLGRRPIIIAGGLGMAASAMNTSLGLVGVTILSDHPGAAWLALAPPVVLFIAYSAYTSKRRDHERLQLLYEATRRLNSSPDIESVTATAATQVRMLLEGQMGEIILFSPTHPDTAFSTRIGTGAAVSTARCEVAGALRSRAICVGIVIAGVGYGTAFGAAGEEGDGGDDDEDFWIHFDLFRFLPLGAHRRRP